ncbi:MAG: RNA-binding protein [Verrucomicrobiota bacterium]
MNESRLFVGNLAFQTGENDLRELFSKVGPLTSVNLMVDKFNGKSRGFAFVEFASAEDAKKAVEQLHSKEFQGQEMTVNIARPREERSPQPAGGGFRGDRREDRRQA